MRLIQVTFKLRPKRNNNNNNQQKKKKKQKKQKETKEKKLIGNLQVTSSLSVDFTKFARAVFWLPSFYF